MTKLFDYCSTQRAILLHLISDLYDYNRLFPAGMIPLSTESWEETFESFLPEGSFLTLSDEDKKETYQSVLNVARTNFPTKEFAIVPIKTSEERELYYLSYKTQSESESESSKQS